MAVEAHRHWAGRMGLSELVPARGHMGAVRANLVERMIGFSGA